jgi:transglycosylase-like protein with SLT domain
MASQMVAGVTQVVRKESPPGRDHIRPMNRSASGSSLSCSPSSGGVPSGTRVPGKLTEVETIARTKAFSAVPAPPQTLVPRRLILSVAASYNPTAPMRAAIRVTVPVIALLLSACGASQNTAAKPQPSASHPATSAAASPTLAAATPAPINAAYVANELAGVEQAIRLPDTPVEEYTELGRRQQDAYHLLGAHSDWVPVVLSTVPPSLRPVIQDNLSAAQQIDTLNGARGGLPHWRIIAPPAPDVLLGYYRESQQAYGVAWQVLAAINLIETNMGRIQGLSSAGAQGPMQFMPATWASYGRGDVNNPHDAILAAGRYLKAHKAATDMTRAIYAYNPSWLYVRAVQLYAKQMFDDPHAYLGYYNWQVYVQTTKGEVLLPEGFSG